MALQDGAVLWRTFRIKQGCAIRPAAHQLLGARGEGIEGVILALRMVLFTDAELTDIGDRVVEPQLKVHEIYGRGTTVEKALNVAGGGISAAERLRLSPQRPLHLRDDLDNVTA